MQPSGLRTESSSATLGPVIELPPTDIFGQSLGLVDHSLRLIRVTRDLRRSIVWSRAGRRRPIYGASDIGQTNLAGIIQAKIAAGLLPCARPEKMLVGYGSSKACDACEQPVTMQDREYEFEAPGLGTLRLHAECLAMWHIERVKQVVEGDGSAGS
jgi:hypothetical protein